MGWLLESSKNLSTRWCRDERIPSKYLRFAIQDQVRQVVDVANLGHEDGIPPPPHFNVVFDYFVHSCLKMCEIQNIVAAFWGMQVSPAKHSYAWLPRKCDYRTDTQTDGRTDRRRTKWYLRAAMLRRQHNKMHTWCDFYRLFGIDILWRHRWITSGMGLTMSQPPR